MKKNVKGKGSKCKGGNKGTKSPQTSPAPTGSGGKGSNKGPETSPAPRGSGGKGTYKRAKTSPAPTGSGERSWKKARALVEESQEVSGKFQPINDEDKITFDGARAVVLPPHKCDFCGQSYAYASCLVICRRDGCVPYMNSGRVAELKKQMERVTNPEKPPPPFKPQLDVDVMSCCYRCYGKKFKGDAGYYVKDTPKGQSIVTSEFSNLRKKNKGRCKSEEAYTCKYLYKKACNEHPEHAVSLEEVYLTVCQSPELAKAADFSVTLGPGCFIQYTCSKCRTFPANPKFWLRCVSNSQGGGEGGTETSGHWRCPKTGCCERWTWRSGGSRRVLILPNVSSTAPTGSGVKMVLIGEVNEEENHLIGLIKAGKLLEHIKAQHKGRGMVKLGIPALVRAIDRMNELAGAKIIQDFPHELTKACSIEEIANHQVKSYCEDARLSLKYPGTYYKAIVVSEEIKAISPIARQELLDTLVCFFNVDRCKPKKPGACRNAWNRAKDAQEKLRHKIFWTEEELQMQED